MDEVKTAAVTAAVDLPARRTCCEACDISPTRFAFPCVSVDCSELLVSAVSSQIEFSSCKACSFRLTNPTSSLSVRR